MAHVISVAPATPRTLVDTLRHGWTRFINNTNRMLEREMYGEEIVLTDSLERELAQRELHPHAY